MKRPSLTRPSMPGRRMSAILVLVVAAAAAGLYFSGLVGGSDPHAATKHAMEPIQLSEPFIVNLTDPGGESLVSMSVAVKLEPMETEQYAAFMGLGGGGHGGGATEAPGPAKVAAYPKFRGAVIDVVSRYSSERLLSPEGKAQLQKDLLTRFAEIAQVDAAEAEVTVHDPEHAPLAPPYNVMEVEFTNLAVQPSS